MRRSKRKFEKDTARNAALSPKLFWSHVRSKLKSRESIAPLFKTPHKKETIKHQDEDKANILQKQFSSVYTIELEGELPNFENKTRTCIAQITITPVMVAKNIGLFEYNKKACGLDGMHPRQLRELVDHVSAPLLGSESISKGREAPIGLENAVVSPIFKKGDKVVAANYRPISLTDVRTRTSA